MPTTTNRLAIYCGDASSCEPEGDDLRWFSSHRHDFSLKDESVSEQLNASAIDQLLREFATIKFGQIENALRDLLRERNLREPRDSSRSIIAITVPINSLLPEPFRVINPIPAVVQGADGDYTASFFDANIGASGETQQEAIDNLKELLIMCFESLEGDGDDVLGPIMKRQKAVLLNHMKRD